MKKGFQANHEEHQLMMQMMKELSEEQVKLKRAGYARLLDKRTESFIKNRMEQD